jgi:hypothetical protein
MEPVRPLSRADRPLLNQVSRAIVDRRMDRLRLLASGSINASAFPTGILEGDTFELLFVDGSVLRIRWAMAGRDEGIAVTLASLPLEADRLASVNLSQVSPWSGLIGHVVTQVRVAWQQLAPDGLELLWAISLRSSGGLDACIALGEIVEQSVDYIPDSLVAICSAKVAHDYHNPASRTTAWGEPLSTDF